MKKAEIKYNPYQCTAQITANGRSDTTLKRFERRAFSSYFSEIFRYLDGIIGDPYELEFTGRPFEGELLKRAAENSGFCQKVKFQNIEIDYPVLQRVDKILKLAAKNGQSITGDRVKAYTCAFGFQNDVELQQAVNRCFARKELNSGLWKVTPEWLTFVNRRKLEELEDRQDVLFVFCRQESNLPIDIKDYLKRHHYNYAFVICVDETPIKQKGEFNCYLTLTAPVRKLADIMYDCLLFGPISDAFKSCYEYFNRDDINADPNFKEAFTVSSPINVALPDCIELGESRTPLVTCKGMRVAADRISYRSQRSDIIDVCHNQLVGKGEGSCMVWAFETGSPSALCGKMITVKKRILVTDLLFLDNALQDGGPLVMKAGSTLKVSVHYYPEHAENWNLRTWRSSNVNVAIVDKNGNVKALSCGSTTITCSVEGVSKSLQVNVKPQLKKIIVGNIGTPESPDVLEIQRGLNFNLDIRLIPEGAIDTQLRITSDNTDIADISGHMVRPISVGETSVTIRNASGTVSKRFTVVVKDMEAKPTRKKFLGIF